MVRLLAAVAAAAALLVTDVIADPPPSVTSALAASIVADPGSPAADDTAPSLVPTTFDGQSYGCRCYVGESCWPGLGHWKQLNSSVDGNLIVNIPPGAPCYDTFSGPLGDVETYDAAICTVVNASFADEQWQ